MVEVHPQSSVAHPLDHLGEEAEEPVLAHGLVIEGREHEDPGAAAAHRLRREPHGVGERAGPRAREEAIRRDTVLQDGVEQALALVHRERIRLAGRAEGRQRRAPVREEPAAMPRQPPAVRREVGVEGRQHRGEDAAKAPRVGAAGSRLAQMTPSFRKASISASPMPRTSPSTSPRVLAEERRRAVAHRRPGEAHGRGHHRHPPGERMRHLDAEAAGPDVRILEHLREVVDGAAGHARLLERADPVPRGPVGEERLEDGDERRAVLDARGVGGEARVGRELGPPRHLAQARELAVVSHRHDQVPVPRGEGLVRHDAGVRVPEPGRHATGDEVALGQVRERRHLDVEEREVHALPLAAPLAVGQRRQHRRRRVHAGEDVRHGHAGLHGLAVRLARHAHEATHGLHHEVVAGPVLVRARLPEASDGAVHEPRVERREVLPSEPEARERADLEVLEEHVRPLGQAADDGLALGPGEVHGDGLLAAVCAGEVGGLARLGAIRCGEPGRAPAPRLVPRPRPLDLHHLGAEVGEELARPGSREDP